MPLFDENGQRVRGKSNQEAAETALAKVKVANETDPAAATGHERWPVAKVCSEYLQYCERGVANNTISKGHRDNAVAWLNDLCGYCGAMPVAELKKGHIKTWLESHPTWRSPATHRGVVAIVLAAFNYAEGQYDVTNPLKGLKKPASQPRLHSFSKEDEEAIYGATEERFRDFLFAGIHTGLRPFCELARVTADDVEENGRGMMWRIYASKTKKTRKIPVRAEVAELTRKLMKTAPRGSGLPLFRNTKGKPWKRMTGVVRFLMLKKKLGWDQDPTKTRYSCYTCRHTFAHRMLSGYWSGSVGCSIETLAELIGDTPKVAFDHYGKEWGQHYQDPLWSAIGAGPKGNNVQTPSKPSKNRSKSQREPVASRTGKEGKRRMTKRPARRRNQIPRRK
jgi:integrase